ncbi:hypothetical protein ACJY8V_001003 [Escherichia coli]|nr:hypothetical protein [Escherichia coli]EFE3811395.1 hypothetical protein [Escherichia coli]EJF6665653.1 hypothetical protein [Escherichia coli]EJK1952124.1 hypothetical protein [Escherichia coli]HCN8164509.1 hypothetical protein [Escherichia coli]
MEKAKFFLVYVAMLAFFLWPSITILFFDETRLTSTDFILVLTFFGIGVALLIMGIRRLLELARLVKS